MHSFAAVLSLPQTLVLVSQERRHQIFDQAPRTGLDLDGDGHAGGQIDHPALDLKLRPIERDARRIHKFLALRLACFRQRRLRTGRRRALRGSGQADRRGQVAVRNAGARALHHDVHKLLHPVQGQR